MNRLQSRNVVGVALAALDCDPESRLVTQVPHNLCLTGDAPWKSGDPDSARAAMEQHTAEVRSLLQGNDILFLVAGLGGGTGSGATPAIAALARELGILTVAVVTMPFDFEHARRHSAAARSLHRLEQEADTLLVIGNDRLLELNRGPAEMMNDVVDDVLAQTLQAVNALVNATGLINVDFADVRAVMSGGTQAIITCGSGYGPRRAVRAAEEAMSSTLLGQTIDGASGLVFNVTGGSDMSLLEVSQIASLLRGRVADEANIIMGTIIDPGLDDEIRITVIATGCQSSFYRPLPREEKRLPAQPPAAPTAQRLRTPAFQYQ